ncbi:murein hydrolase activator EnvC family protein [Viridibacterium curvum]|uniref:murein hydrolase activator EnvC family protein n=1 Tax=Viridibacterium curvum TaxID=1101404 RepID=UPI0031E67B6A
MQAQAAESRETLKGLREQIRSLQNEISRGEEDKGEVIEQLADTDRAISDAQRRLREIANDRQAMDREILRLQSETDKLETRLSASRKQLGTTLYRIYVEGGEAGARRLLGGQDPNQMARDAYYLEQIAAERRQAIEAARKTLADLQIVRADAEARRAELLRLEGERHGEQQKLQEERARRQRMLQNVAERLKVQRREVQQLIRSQARLEKLLQGLERIARENAAKEAERKSRRAASASRSSAPVKAASSTSSAASSGRQVQEAAEPGVASGNFARLQGKLRWPVKGELFGRFGSPRGDGSQWRGVFIRAAEGAEVRAVADGKVAYADWLRGFGNLIIVDHGDGYMTIYANNDTLFKTPGQTVRMGEPIAGVGASGGQEESGLYFEIRHRGQPADPARWVAAK